MSEYQYYEFQAIDRPLTEREQRTLRSYSTRARITSTSFVNDYSWGSFKGDEDAWMEKYFDAFLYIANWGTRVFQLRLPARLLAAKVARPYCVGECASMHRKGGSVILTFTSQDEDGDWVEGEGGLSSLISLRAELAGGDLRGLYLGWLLSAQTGRVADDELEPPVPPGLARLSGALASLVEFLRIDSDLVDVAAAASAPIIGRNSPKRQGDRSIGKAAERRSVAALLLAAEQAAAERQREAAERAAKQLARRAREASQLRARHLDRMAGQEPTLWEEIERLITTKQPRSYDRALELLLDLRDLAARSGGTDFRRRLEGLRAAHARKPSFIDRLRKAGL